MTTTEGIISSARRRAERLVDLLFDDGPLTKEQCCRRLGWSANRFAAAVKVARDEVCPELGFVIPAPTPDAGWTYQVTTEWQPVQDGAAYTMGLAETRLAAMRRDVDTVFDRIEPGSIDWRRANFLRKHLHVILAGLSEIRADEEKGL